MKESSTSASGGISLEKLNYCMAAATVLISVLLLLATHRTSEGYAVMRSTTENYIRWQQSASAMQTASDYLTEQVRNFVMTGNVEYLRSYFKEVNVTRRREVSLAQLRGELRGTSAYARLEDAMEQSTALEAREYYAMRLTISAYGYDLTEFPADLQSITLLTRDARLTREERMTRAQEMVLDSEYLQRKMTINEDMRLCLEELALETESQQTNAANDLSELLGAQRRLIIALIVIVLAVIVLTTILIIRPLTQSVQHVRSERAIPVNGSYEFRFLASTYNQMFEASRQKNEQLAYEASHDKLTGLYNRAGYDHLLRNEDMANAALLLIDVDKFKAVNDTYGHDMGDRTLARIAAVLHDSFRSGDYVCRIGGDEFAAIMVNTGSQFTDMIREKVAHINDRLLHPEGDLPAVSVSVGVSFGNNKKNSARIVKDADKALYRVKEAGRCGVAFYE